MSGQRPTILNTLLHGTVELFRNMYNAGCATENTSAWLGWQDHARFAVYANRLRNIRYNICILVNRYIDYIRLYTHIIGYHTMLCLYLYITCDTIYMSVDIEIYTV